MNKTKIYKKNVKTKRYYSISYYMIPRDRSSLGVGLGYWYNPFDKNFNVKDFFFMLLGNSCLKDCVSFSDVYYSIHIYNNKGCNSYSTWKTLI